MYTYTDVLFDSNSNHHRSSQRRWMRELFVLVEIGAPGGWKKEESAGAQPTQPKGIHL